MGWRPSAAFVTVAAVAVTALLAAGCTSAALRPMTTSSIPVRTTTTSSLPPAPGIDQLATPHGWVPVDFGDAQISVPATWVVKEAACGGSSRWPTVQLGVGVSEGCGSRGARPTVTVVSLGSIPAAYRHERPDRLNGIQIFKGPSSAPGITYFVPELQVEVTVTGPMASRVMDTLTASPRAVVLHQGRPPIVPASWRWISFGGIRLATPSRWPIDRTATAKGLTPPCTLLGVWGGPSVVVLDTDRRAVSYFCPVESFSVPVREVRPSERVGIYIGPDQPNLPPGELSCQIRGGLRICSAISPFPPVLAMRVTVPGRSGPVTVSIGLAGNERDRKDHLVLTEGGMMTRHPIAAVTLTILVVVAAGVGILAVTGNGRLDPATSNASAVQSDISASSAVLVADGIRLELTGQAANGQTLNVLILNPTPSAMSRLAHRTNTRIMTRGEYLAAATGFLRHEFGPSLEVSLTAPVIPIRFAEAIKTMRPASRRDTIRPWEYRKAATRPQHSASPVAPDSHRVRKHYRLQIVQFEPFQCSMRVWFPDAALWPPTATQSVALTHATAEKSLLFEGLALFAISQLEPFQCSASVFEPLVLFRFAP